METLITASAAALLALTKATPTPVRKGAHSCEQWGSVVTGAYTVYNNLWGRGSATSGEQCFGVDGLDGESVSWHASWTWEGGQFIDSSGQQISAVSSMPSTWSWTYAGDDLVANVAYDFFTSSTAGGTVEFELMVWLAALGGAGPISSTYGVDGSAMPIASVDVAGQSWKLYKGPNGQMTVFSFVADSTIKDFSGDMKDFFDYLVSYQGYDDAQYLVSAGAGTEPFTGSNAIFTSSEYSIAIE